MKKYSQQQQQNCLLGLSDKCVHKDFQKAVPGAGDNDKYKVLQYYQYDQQSYFEAEVEMEKFRCPQPSSL